MAGAKEWYLVAYDIRDEKRLRRVARHLSGYGVRVQYSLFRVRATRREAECLRWQLLEIVAAEDDLLIVPLAGGSLERLWQKNDADAWKDDQPSCIIV